MEVYIGFDDTDNVNADRGTGKLARWFKDELPEDCYPKGVLRQQLLIHKEVPYTSHNSSACLIVDVPDASMVETLITKAIAHVERHSLEGSDPGVCVVGEGDTGLPGIIDLGRRCTEKIVTQREAIEATRNSHLSGHGGTNDGIIGAAAAVGLTASGWSGRFIEYNGLRDFPDPVHVSDLELSNIIVVSVDRDATVPAPGDLVYTKGWLRPRLLGGRAVLIVNRKSEGTWESIGGKRKKGHSYSPSISRLL